ncbi:MAG: DUF6265 family protein [Bacteroidota bacterium]
MKLKSLLFGAITGFVFSFNLLAQDTSPDYAWLAGNWVGDGFGGTSEEMWSPPSEDGTMMGTYRHHNADGSLNFYEFMLLDESGLRLKHFSSDMEGWETKDKHLTFEMIDYSKDKIELKGLTFERISDTEMEIKLKMKSEGGVRTEVFHMSRR